MYFNQQIMKYEAFGFLLVFSLEASCTALEQLNLQLLLSTRGQITMGHCCKLNETPSAEDANFVKCSSLMPELVKSFCLDSLFLFNTTCTLSEHQPTNLKLATTRNG